MMPPNVTPPPKEGEMENKSPHSIKRRNTNAHCENIFVDSMSTYVHLSCNWTLKWLNKGNRINSIFIPSAVSGFIWHLTPARLLYFQLITHVKL